MQLSVQPKWTGHEVGRFRCAASPKTHVTMQRPADPSDADLLHGCCRQGSQSRFQTFEGMIPR